MPLGPPRARWLPVTGPADVHRRLWAASAPVPAHFASRAADLWAEWPLPQPPVVPDALRAEARVAGVGLAVGRDRLFLAGTAARLRALGARVAGSAGDPWRALGEWLGAPGGVPAAGEGARGAGAAWPPLTCGPFRLHFGHKTYVVGIVNRTRESFSEERSALPSVAETVRAAWRAVRGGADVVDLGAESTEERDRGGIDPAEEAARLLPVVEALAELPAILSLDTRHAAVVEAALRLGPVLVNDVDALADPGLARAVARAGVPVVLMHQRPEAEAGRGDVVAEVLGFLRSALARARECGVAEAQVVLDAGFGFGKSVAEDLECTRRLGELRALGRPLLHAPSRKRTIGRVLGFPQTIPERLPGTAAAVAIGIAAGADMVRVHDLPEMARVARATDALLGRPAWEDLTAV